MKNLITVYFCFLLLILCAIAVTCFTLIYYKLHNILLFCFEESIIFKGHIKIKNTILYSPTYLAFLIFIWFNFAYITSLIFLVTQVSWWQIFFNFCFNLLRDIFNNYRILGWLFLSFSTLKSIYSSLNCF